MKTEPLIDVLVRRLAEAIVWCGGRADAGNPATCLRTIDTGSDPFLGRSQRVEWVAQRRQHRLGESGCAAAAATTPADLQQGRLLAFLPDCNLYHGLESGECGGYIDTDNNPPGDTWLVYLPEIDGVHRGRGGCLLSWVPPMFVEPVHLAITVNPEQCLCWFDQTNSRLSRELNRRLQPAARFTGRAP
jgi:hypothetical protein